MIKIKKDERGITLIALIITVIVLLILAGTAISIAINGGDIFSKASEARKEWNISVEKEETELQNLMDLLNTVADGGNTPSEGYESLVQGIQTNYKANSEDETTWEVLYSTVSDVYLIGKCYPTTGTRENETGGASLFTEENEVYFPALAKGLLSTAYDIESSPHAVRSELTRRNNKCLEICCLDVKKF